MVGLITKPGSRYGVAPGVKDLAHIKAIVDAVAPKPVNVLLLDSSMNVADLLATGVRRVSVGFSFAAAAWAGFDEATQSVRDNGIYRRQAGMTTQFSAIIPE